MTNQPDAAHKTTFDTQMRNRQVAWRNNPDNGICSGNGWQNGLQYPWILPSDKWEQSLWPGIRSGTANSLPAYLGSEIQPHQGKHNLNSSWVLCANLYFPFGATAVAQHGSPSVWQPWLDYVTTRYGY